MVKLNDRIAGPASRQTVRLSGPGGVARMRVGQKCTRTMPLHGYICSILWLVADILRVDAQRA
jgi:hypothetical protein